MALNSGDDATQRLTVTLQARNHLGWAVLVLLIAALLSFVATRVVTTLRQRAAFLGRVHAMRPYWLGNETPTLPVIWLRATLRQAEDLSRRFWLSGQSEIDAKLLAAQGMLDVLTRAREVRMRIDGISSFAVKRRALWKLGSLIHAIPAATLRDQDVTRIKADLDKLDGWGNAAKMEAEYWADLLPAINARHSEVQSAAIPDSGAAMADALLKLPDAAAATTPPDLKQKVAAEEVYQRLSILWDLRNDADLVKAVVDMTNTAPIAKVFAVLDNVKWAAVQAATEHSAVEGPSGDPPEAYDPVIFRVAFGVGREVSTSYLVQYKLTYSWTISIFDAKGKDVPVRTLIIDSSQPEIAQYSPQAGAMSATVAIKYNGVVGSNAAQKARTVISASSDFHAGRIIETSDGWAFGIALLTSVISGLALYAVKPGFGSLQDYVALFTWGASLDQGKNFIQSLATYKR